MNKTDALVKIVNENGGLDMSFIESNIKSKGYVVCTSSVINYITVFLKDYYPEFSRVARKAAWKLL